MKEPPLSSPAGRSGKAIALALRYPTHEIKKKKAETGKRGVQQTLKKKKKGGYGNGDSRRRSKTYR